MSGFQLDTSGLALATRPDGSGHLDGWLWEHLTPFAQGYVEALFASARAALHSGRIVGRDRIHYPADHPRAFSDLSPSALAVILKDCEARLRHMPSLGQYPGVLAGDVTRYVRENGARFWRWRQAGECKNFPPLTISLGDDGLIYLKAEDA